MGTGWSQEDLPESQQNREESERSENATEGKPVCNCNTSEKRSNGDKKATEAAKTAPENIPTLDSIMQDADLAIGILLNQNRKKYWVDKMGKNCFMLYARDLSITWSENDNYWIWRRLKDGTSDEPIEIAELMNVCWLEVHGKFDTKELSPASLYEVTFVVMLKYSAYGWGIPVNVALNLPDGRKQEQKVSMLQQPKEQWMEIPVGEFRTSPEILGEIQVSMYEFDGGKWKRGLIIKGVKIQPKIKC